MHASIAETRACVQPDEAGTGCGLRLEDLVLRALPPGADGDLGRRDVAVPGAHAVPALADIHLELAGAARVDRLGRLGDPGLARPELVALERDLLRRAGLVGDDQDDRAGAEAARRDGDPAVGDRGRDVQRSRESLGVLVAAAPSAADHDYGHDEAAG